MRDPDLPYVVTRDRARRAGLTDRQIDWRVSTGRWRRLRTNVLHVPRPASEWLDDDALRMLAALRSTTRDVAVAQAHAALVWGLPRPLAAAVTRCWSRRPDRIATATTSRSS